MKHRHFLLLFFILGIVGSYAQSSGNFVTATTYLDEAGSHALESVQYYDGLGRPTQAVSDLGNGRYVGVFKEYDLQGQEVRTWTGTPLTGLSPMCVSDFSSAAQSYHEDRRPFLETEYDALSRPIRQWREGQQWQDHPSATRYFTNTAEEVRRYGIDSNNSLYGRDDYWPAGSLKGEEYTNEDGHIVRNFMDLDGHRLLERRGSEDTQWYDTYFVYDDYGLLRFVLTPEYETSPDLSLSAYCYRYDNQSRCVWKRMPGQGATTYVYDAAGRVVLQQDALLRERGLYRFFVYDGHGRPAVQGTCSGNVPASFNQVVTCRFDAESAGILGTGYVLPNSAMMGNLQDPSLEIATYYDHYSFLTHTCFSSYSNVADMGPSLSSLVDSNFSVGSKTGEVVLTDKGSLLYRTYFYDIFGRKIEEHRSMLSGRVERTFTEYSFTGKPKCVTRVVPYPSRMLSPILGTSLTEHVITTSYSYDEASDELVGVNLKYGATGEDVALVMNTYDALGRLSAAYCPGTGYTTTYDYDIHGWTNEISHPRFVETLYYADGKSGSSCYNGDISTMTWSRGEGFSPQGYIFSYDERDMLKTARFAAGRMMNLWRDRYTEQVEGYTPNGAISALKRSGKQSDGSYGLIDDLYYTYDGPHLCRIDDAHPQILSYNGAFEYVDGHTGASVDFTYNAAGMLTSDLDKGIERITYNSIGMTDSIIFASGAKIVYEYALDGEKLRVKRYAAPLELTYGTSSGLYSESRISSSFPVFPTQPLYPIQCIRYDETFYLGDGLEVHQSPLITVNSFRYDFGSGYMTLQTGTTEATGEPRYYYYVKDHLGSIRSVITRDAETDEVTEVQRTTYYPFGGIIADLSTGRDVQPYLYNGKELDTASGLNWYDYGARQYDPAAPHFTNPDPMQEKYYPWNSYIYCLNNPVRFVDPDGRFICVKVDEQLYKYNINIMTFIDGNGIEYKGNDEFVITTLNTINEIIQGDAGYNLISELAQSDKGVIIAARSKNSEQEWTYDDENMISAVAFDYKKMSNLKVPDSTLYTSLTHELAHSLDRINGTLDSNRWDIGVETSKTITNAEKYATFVENRIRAEHNLPLRQSYVYSTEGAPSGGYIVKKRKRQSLFFDKNGNHKPNYGVVKKNNRYQF